MGYAISLLSTVRPPFLETSPRHNDPFVGASPVSAEPARVCSHPAFLNPRSTPVQANVSAGQALGFGPYPVLPPVKAKAFHICEYNTHLCVCQSVAANFLG